MDSQEKIIKDVEVIVRKIKELYDLAYDWAESGDTDMDAYQKDVAAFKKRWFKKTRTAQIKEMIDICADNLKEDLYRAFGCNAETNGEPRVQ